MIQIILSNVRICLFHLHGWVHGWNNLHFLPIDFINNTKPLNTMLSSRGFKCGLNSNGISKIYAFTHLTSKRQALRPTMKQMPKFTRPCTTNKINMLRNGLLEQITCKHKNIAQHIITYSTKS